MTASRHGALSEAGRHHPRPVPSRHPAGRSGARAARLGRAARPPPAPARLGRRRRAHGRRRARARRPWCSWRRSSARSGWFGTAGPRARAPRASSAGVLCSCRTRRLPQAARSPEPTRRCPRWHLVVGAVALLPVLASWTLAPDPRASRGDPRPRHDLVPPAGRRAVPADRLDHHGPVLRRRAGDGVLPDDLVAAARHGDGAVRLGHALGLRQRRAPGPGPARGVALRRPLRRGGPRGRGGGSLFLGSAADGRDAGGHRPQRRGGLGAAPHRGRPGDPRPVERADARAGRGRRARARARHRDEGHVPGPGGAAGGGAGRHRRPGPAAPALAGLRGDGGHRPVLVRAQRDRDRQPGPRARRGARAAPPRSGHRLAGHAVGQPLPLRRRRLARLPRPGLRGRARPAVVRVPRCSWPSVWSAAWWRPPPASVRLVALVGIASLVAFIFTPQYLDFGEGKPFFFPTNLRYAAPGVRVGLLLSVVVLRRLMVVVLPGARRSARSSRRPTRSAGRSSVAHVVLPRPDRPRPRRWRGRRWCSASSLVVGRGRVAPRPDDRAAAIRTGALVLAASLAVVLVVAAVHPRYTDHRYDDADRPRRAVPLVATDEDSRIGTIGILGQVQYPLAGPDLANHVRLPGGRDLRRRRSPTAHLRGADGPHRARPVDHVVVLGTELRQVGGHPAGRPPASPGSSPRTSGRVRAGVRAGPRPRPTATADADRVRPVGAPTT